MWREEVQIRENKVGGVNSSKINIARPHGNKGVKQANKPVQ